VELGLRILVPGGHPGIERRPHWSSRRSGMLSISLEALPAGAGRPGHDAPPRATPIAYCPLVPYWFPAGSPLVPPFPRDAPGYLPGRLYR
jgi:hypothetical protein